MFIYNIYKDLFSLVTFEHDTSGSVKNWIFFLALRISSSVIYIE